MMITLLNLEPKPKPNSRDRGREREIATQPETQKKRGKQRKPIIQNVLKQRKRLGNSENLVITVLISTFADLDVENCFGGQRREAGGPDIEELVCGAGDPSAAAAARDGGAADIAVDGDDASDVVHVDVGVVGNDTEGHLGSASSPYDLTALVEGGICPPNY